MKESDKYIIIKKYLEQHSLVESNIISFNNFIGWRLPKIIEEINEINASLNEEIEIKLGKIRLEKPNIIEADGSSNLILPTEARLRNLTYSSPIFVEITIKQGDHNETQEVEIGRIPVIVKSKLCNTYGMSKEELIKNYIDPNDPGGYFIINGNERVMVLIEDLASNQPFINIAKDKVSLRMFSQKGAYKIPVSITENNEGILEISFSRFKNIPVIVLLKALGMVKDADIVSTIGKETDTLIVNMFEFANLFSSDDALLYIAEKSSLQGTKKEILDRVKQRIDSFFMPHIGTRKEDRYEKAITLCRLVRQFLIAKENPNTKTDKDHYANKRVKLCGDMLADLFRVNLNMFVRDIRYSLTKSIKRRKIFSIKSIAKSTLFSHRIESAIATGSWIGERTGVTQNMDKTNYLSIFSQLQRISSILPGEQENFAARTLHPTHYGRFCPIETPEGTEIGLRKNLALLAKISTAITIETEELIKEFKKCGLSESGEENDVFLNGRFIGTAKEIDQNINPEVVILSELWMNCYDGKYEILETIAMSAPVYDTGMISAIKIAEILETHPKVHKVYYPGLPSHPQHELAKKQMKGFGGMISADLGSFENAIKFFNRLKLFLRAESLGGVESLVCHPVSMTHGSVPSEEREKFALTDGLI
ncbi:MAG: DNA-directed RNA polymerase subunit B'', partial [Candidatus Pacearchaeota archaeon]